MHSFYIWFLLLFVKVWNSRCLWKYGLKVCVWHPRSLSVRVMVQSVYVRVKSPKCLWGSEFKMPMSVKVQSVYEGQSSKFIYAMFKVSVRVRVQNVREVMIKSVCERVMDQCLWGSGFIMSLRVRVRNGLWVSCSKLWVEFLVQIVCKDLSPVSLNVFGQNVCKGQGSMGFKSQGLKCFCHGPNLSVRESRDPKCLCEGHGTEYLWRSGSEMSVKVRIEPLKVFALESRFKKCEGQDPTVWMSVSKVSVQRVLGA